MKYLSLVLLLGPLSNLTLASDRFYFKCNIEKKWTVTFHLSDEEDKEVWLVTRNYYWSDKEPISYRLKARFDHNNSLGYIFSIKEDVGYHYVNGKKQKIQGIVQVLTESKAPLVNYFNEQSKFYEFNIKVHAVNDFYM